MPSGHTFWGRKHVFITKNIPDLLEDVLVTTALEGLEHLLSLPTRASAASQEAHETLLPRHQTLCHMTDLIPPYRQGDDDVCYLFLQKPKKGAKLHIPLGRYVP